MKAKASSGSAEGWAHEHLIDLQRLSQPQLQQIFDLASRYQKALANPVTALELQKELAGHEVVNLFFEASTRTRISFELAAGRLGAQVVNFSEQTSSASKGESLLDTAHTIVAMGVDTLVVRHTDNEAAEFLAQNVDAAVVNAGSGTQAHPTQGLLDLYSVLQHLDSVAGKRVAIVGDILHSRVARSDILAFRHFGAELTLVGPEAWVPNSLAQEGVAISQNFDEALESSDIVIMLRVQKERQSQQLGMSNAEYIRGYGLNSERLASMPEGALVLHPGPMNRGVEISSEVADCNQSLVLEQVRNGVLIRMAVLKLLAQARQSR